MRGPVEALNARQRDLRMLSTSVAGDGRDGTLSPIHSPKRAAASHRASLPDQGGNMGLSYNSSMPLTAPGYPALDQPHLQQPQPQPQQRTLPPPSPLMPATDIAMHRAVAQRSRGNLNAQMQRDQTKPRDDELFFNVPGAASAPAAPSGYRIARKPVRRQPTDGSVASTASFAPPSRTGPMESTVSSATSVSSAATAPSMSVCERAAHIEEFARTDHESGGLLAQPRLFFEGDSRRLTPACQRSLLRQYEELAPLRRQAEQYMLDVESGPELRAELARMGVDMDALSRRLETLTERCGHTMDAISLRTAQSQIPVADVPVAAWVATKMMHSAESREELNRYLQDQRPLELQVKSNLLAQLNTELDRIPSSHIAPEYARRRDAMLAKIHALQGEIDGLKESVGNHPLPLHETATEVTHEVAARYLAAKYDPVRGHLHQMREAIQQMLRRKQCSPAEQRQLGVFAAQLQKVLDGAQDLEYRRTWLRIEDSHARKVIPRIAYSPEAAISLDTRIGFYGALGVSQPAPDYPHELRRQRDESRERHRQSYGRYQHQLSVQQTTGALIHPAVITELQTASAAATAAAARYEAAKADYARAHAQWEKDDAPARRNRALKELSQSVQYTMLDDKINALMMQGFTALRDAPEPKPKAGEIDRLRSAYYAQQEKLGTTAPGGDRSTVALRQQLEAKLAFLDQA